MNITKTFLNQIQYSDKERIYFDDSLTGFGVRVGKTSATYVVMYRTKFGEQRKQKICKINQMTLQEAREEAKQILALVIQGKDPQAEKMALKKEMLLKDFIEEFLKYASVRIKPTTLAFYKSMIKNQIIPGLGNYPLKELTKSVLKKFQTDLALGKYFKQKTNLRGKNFLSYEKSVLNILCTILSYAVEQDILEYNPVSSLKSERVVRHRAFLTEDDLKKISKLIDNLKCSKGATEYIKKYYRLLALTGCRCSEIAKLTWEEVDLENQIFMFKDTKTGPQNRPFGIAVKKILLQLNKQSTQGKIFQKFSSTSYFTLHFKKQMNIPYLSCHSLRHTFASMGAKLGYSDTIIAGLLGHKLGTMTSRYTHLTNKTLIDAADKISMYIADVMGINLDG